MAFVLHFKDDGTKKIQFFFCFFFVLSLTRSNVFYYTTFLTHFHKIQSVSFQMVSRVCISLLQVLSYSHVDVISGDSWKKGSLMGFIGMGKHVYIAKAREMDNKHKWNKKLTRNITHKVSKQWRHFKCHIVCVCVCTVL